MLWAVEPGEAQVLFEVAANSLVRLKEAQERVALKVFPQHL